MSTTPQNVGQSHRVARAATTPIKSGYLTEEKGAHNVNTLGGRLLPILMHRAEVISLKTAIDRSGKSERTLRGWCSRFGLARQSGPKAPLEISAPALEMVLCGDFEALERLRAGDREDTGVRRYFHHLGITP